MKKGWWQFLGGVLVGSLGFDLLKAKDADKVYTAITAAVLVARNRVLKETEKINARALDIYEEAKIKADDYEARKVLEDTDTVEAFRGTEA
ncbi:MAG: hypothetical protein IIZ17_02880 [Eubacteriaceae bacterium]|nr:hypothetical protein [Eubacteriaceae bacterium]MBQ1465604.1 hypothetical protein [Eubacteriaceae bacterium]